MTNKAIDIQTALDRVREVLLWGRSCGKLLGILEVEEALAAIRGRIAELEGQVPRWIPVSERLPERSSCVLAKWANRHSRIDLVYYGCGDTGDLDPYWAVSSSGYSGPVVEPIAWMPLPPKEGGEK